jgi:L-aminopeptidase/D-esterase-like protein
MHAVVLAGGSAFGLDAAAGAMQYLEEKGIGFDVGVTTVPIVGSAVLFDLTVGDYKVRPDKEMGYRACQNANSIECPQGTVGAGTGATVGKYLGMESAMKGGLGTYCLRVGELMVGAIVAVNCLGDVINPANGEILAGAISEDNSFINTEEAMLKQYDSNKNVFSGNTTIGVIATNAVLTKVQASKVASMAHNGYGRAMRPAHTMFDGDTIFVMATGKIEADVNVVGMLSARVMEQAIVNAVTQATSILEFKSYRDISSLEK